MNFWISMRFKMVLMLGLLAFLSTIASPALAGNELKILDSWTATGEGMEGNNTIDAPIFMPVSEIDYLDDKAPVISVTINKESKTYPLRILVWHQVVNDVVGGIPVVVTYCPYSATAQVFDRRVGSRAHHFIPAGYLNKSNLLLYDKQDKTIWQQYTGKAISGKSRGKTLKPIYAQLESYKLFSEREPKGRVLIPPGSFGHAYGKTPYIGYESSDLPFGYREEVSSDVPAMERVVAVGDNAWTYDLLRKKGTVKHGDIVLTIAEGQYSVLDEEEIKSSKDVGNILVLRQLPSKKGANGEEIELWEGVDHVTSFAFAYRAFKPKGKIHH